MDKLTITGLTGGMGSGKSSVAAFLCRTFPVACFSADRVVHELLEPEQSCWQVVRDLNRAFLREDGTLNKPLFREALFADVVLRREVNRRMHPLVHQLLMEKIERHGRETGQCHFLVEVPLLFEAGWQRLFAAIIVVYARRAMSIGRVMQRDRVSRQQAEQAIACQGRLLDKALCADHVVDNSGMWIDTVLQLLHLGKVLWGDGGIEGQAEKLQKKS